MQLNLRRWDENDSSSFRDGARGRTRTGTGFLPRDFKSLVSTNFTTRARGFVARR